MDYFYDIAPQFATASRRAFDADAGYLGTRFSFFLRWHVARHLSLFRTVQVGYFEGATNDDSPLFRSKVNVGVGFGFTWSIYQSRQRITESSRATL
jgi:outer membrane protein